jgi:hypothetical protein
MQEMQRVEHLVAMVDKLKLVSSAFETSERLASIKSSLTMIVLGNLTIVLGAKFLRKLVRG